MLERKDRFDDVVESVRAKFAALVASPKYSIKLLPTDIPKAGIYLFSEDGKSLYVGRTNKLRRRLQQHTRDNHNQATFGFLLARIETGKLNASYRPEGSRTALLLEPGFRSAFDAARRRITEMDVQFVEELDAVRQTVLEVFVALETKAKFNDFNNHWSSP
jgi:predicted GIY-YIG superfamily endonuclease